MGECKDCKQLKAEIDRLNRLINYMTKQFKRTGGAVTVTLASAKDRLQDIKKRSVYKKD